MGNAIFIVWVSGSVQRSGIQEPM